MHDFPSADLFSILQAADAQQADHLMRQALAELLQAQQEEAAGAWDRLAWRRQAGHLVAPEGNQVLDALQRGLDMQPQVAAAQPSLGRLPAGWELGALLRPAALAWEEEQELDWAIRYWELARRAGMAWDADFGQAWQQIEWAALAGHLSRLGESDARGRALEPRLLAHAVKTATRYRELAPLLPLIERRWPGATQRAFG